MKRKLTALTLAACLALLAGCETIATVVLIGVSLGWQAYESTNLDLAVTPVIYADAGTGANALANETVILDASASAIQLGSGRLITDPTPPLTFVWSLDAAPFADQDGDGDLDRDDLITAGGSLNFADTANAQFASPVPGDYTLRVTVSGLSPVIGIPIGSSAAVVVRVFAGP